MNQPANEKGGQTEVLLVNSVLVDCVGVGPMKCMQVRRSAQQPWGVVLYRHRGFHFRTGLSVSAESACYPGGERAGRCLIAALHAD